MFEFYFSIRGFFKLDQFQSKYLEKHPLYSLFCMKGINIICVNTKKHQITVNSNRKEHLLKQTLSFFNNISSECKGLKRKKMWKVSSRSPLLSDILDQLQKSSSWLGIFVVLYLGCKADYVYYRISIIFKGLEYLNIG